MTAGPAIAAARSRAATELQQTLEGLLDAVEASSKHASYLRREFINGFCSYFAVPEAHLVKMGKKKELTDLGFHRNREQGIAELRQQASESLDRNLERLMPGQPGVHEDVRVTECAYCYKRIMHSLENMRQLAAGTQQFSESLDEDDTVDLMSFLRPDTSGNRGGNPASSKTMSRAPVYPYDRQVSYGRQCYPDASGPVDGMAPGRNPKNAWEAVAEVVEMPMGEDGCDPFEAELEALRADFRTVFDGTLDHARRMDSPSLFKMLSELDPDFAAETFAPEDDSEMHDLYSAWGQHVAGPREDIT